jgi:hypothetical protein
MLQYVQCMYHVCTKYVKYKQCMYSVYVYMLWYVQCMYNVWTWYMHITSTTRLNVFITAGSAKAWNCMHRVSTCTVCTTFVPCTYTWHTLFECVQVLLHTRHIHTGSGLSQWHARVWRSCVLASESKFKCYSMDQKSRVSAFHVKIPIFSLVHDLYLYIHMTSNEYVCTCAVWSFFDMESWHPRFLVHTIAFYFSLRCQVSIAWICHCISRHPIAWIYAICCTVA